MSSGWCPSVNIYLKLCTFKEGPKKVRCSKYPLFQYTPPPPPPPPPHKFVNKVCQTKFVSLCGKIPPNVYCMPSDAVSHSATVSINRDQWYNKIWTSMNFVTFTAWAQKFSRPKCAFNIFMTGNFLGWRHEVNMPASSVTTKGKNPKTDRKYSSLLWLHLVANTCQLCLISCVFLKGLFFPCVWIVPAQHGWHFLSTTIMFNGEGSGKSDHEWFREWRKCMIWGESEEFERVFASDYLWCYRDGENLTE